MYTSDVLPLGLLLDCCGLRLLVLVHNLNKSLLQQLTACVMTPRDNLPCLLLLLSVLSAFVRPTYRRRIHFRLTYISSNTPSRTARIS